MNRMRLQEVISLCLSLFAMGFLVHMLSGCGYRPAAYSAELAECTEVSSTLTQSIECENKVRARYGRPARAMPEGGAP